MIDPTRPAAPPPSTRSAPAPPDASTIDPSGADGRGPPADRTTPSPAADRGPALAPDLPGRAAPPGYEIFGVLGRGGMGVVYHARQTDLDRPVALKMILAGAHAGGAEVARFAAEAEGVARVRHPNVVEVYHAGRHDGLPFLAMELVAGGSLADRLRDGPLPPPEAARVVEQVARGIAASHARGVLHRDLKPQNILLAADGTPKVTDFGLAKRLDVSDGPTVTGAVMGTPSYMSPEQARGEVVGPATDVYGLGAVLYAALSGRPPFQAPTPVETLRRVTDDDPVGVRMLQPGVPRDLETIAHKCLRKDPATRYRSAAEVADDLGRWANGEPIAARPAGSVERGWKWAKRNRTPAGAGAAVFLALAAGAGVAVWQAGVARAEATNAGAAQGQATREGLAARAAEANAVEREREEKRQRETAEAVKQFLQHVLAQSDVYQSRPGMEVRPDQTVLQAMDQAVRQIGDRFAGQPLVEAELRHVIGTAYLNLGAYDKAEAQFNRVIAVARAAVAPDHPSVLQTRINLGIAFQARGDYRRAEQYLTEVLTTAERVLRPDHPITLEAVFRLGSLYNVWGKRPERVEGLLTRAYAGQVRELGERHPQTLATLSSLGTYHRIRGRDAEAERDLARALSGLRAVCGDDHPRTLEAYKELGVFCASRGRNSEAEPLLRRAVAGWRAVLGDHHPVTLSGVYRLGQLYLGQRRYVEAEPLLVEAFAGARARPGEGGWRRMELTDELARLYRDTGRYDRAEPLLRELCDQLERIGHRDVSFFATRSDLGEALLGQRKYPEAERVLLDADRGLRGFESDPAERPYAVSATGLTARRLVRLYEATGQPGEAARWRAEMTRYRERAPLPRPAGN